MILLYFRCSYINEPSEEACDADNENVESIVSNIFFFIQSIHRVTQGVTHPRFRIAGVKPQPVSLRQPGVAGPQTTLGGPHPPT